VARGEDRGDLFEGRIAGALADAVDGALDLPRPAFDAGQRVGDGHAEVVVAMGGVDDVLAARNPLAHGAEKLRVLGGRGIADRVGDVDRSGAGLDRNFNHFDEEVEVGASAVFGRELDVVRVHPCEPDGLAGMFQRLLAGDLELGLEVQVGAGEEDVDAVFGGRLDGAGGGFDVLALAAGE
jgi:hypothetical protein